MCTYFQIYILFSLFCRSGIHTSFPPSQQFSVIVNAAAPLLLLPRQHYVAVRRGINLQLIC